MNGLAPRSARAVVWLAALVVPGHRREAWRRQWLAELEHRCRAGGSPSRGVFRFSLGSILHAAYLRRRETTTRGWVSDVRHSARSLVRRPFFSFLAVATLAAGIGSATAVFSLAEALLLRPLPLDESDRLVRIYSRNPTRGHGWFSVSQPDFADFMARSDLFEAGSLYTAQNRDVAGGGEPERVSTVAVHDGFFETLRSPTVHGRVLGPSDQDPRAEETAVLSEAFWRARFGADPEILGRTIRLDGVPHTVVGVVRHEAGWPPGAQVWTTLRWGGTVPDAAAARSNHAWSVIARLRPGVGVDEASEQVEAMAVGIYARPGTDERDVGTEALVVPLHSSEGGEDAGILFTLLGSAVFLVLAIACMNASALLLTRAWSRARELSLRSALGAGRGRLAAVLLGESAVLALAGGAVGIVLGTVGLRRAFAMAPAAVTDLGVPRLNGTVAVAGLAISVGAAVMAGLLPALRASRIPLADQLRDGSVQAGSGWVVTRLRRGLVVAELAFSLALLVGAGLTIRGLQRQLSADPGFDAETLVSFTVRLPTGRYGEPALVDAYYREATERLERDPRIEAAASVSRLPLGAGGYALGRSFIVDGDPAPPQGEGHPADWIEVDPGYFRTLGIRPMEGRAFTRDDRADAPAVAIVSRDLAERMSPDASIVGRQIRSQYDENLPRTVVGVAPNVQMYGVSRTRARPFVLVPREQAVRASMAFLVRASGDAADAIPAIRRVMGDLDADVALDELRTLRDAHASDLGGIRFLTTLFAAFGALALILSTSGVYGLVSHSVSQRTREIGVRMAMGATAGSVRGAVVRESAVLTAVGLLLGLGLAYAMGRVLAFGMDGIALLEPSTFVGVAVLLAGAVLAATWLPATRATRVDPVEALRAE